jgi:hypothetical protein
MTYALRGACALPAYALAAPIAPVIALTALAALGLPDDPVHEPVHARGLCVLSSCAVRDLAEDAVSADASGPCGVMSRQFYRPLALLATHAEKGIGLTDTDPGLHLRHQPNLL